MIETLLSYLKLESVPYIGVLVGIYFLYKSVKFFVKIILYFAIFALVLYLLKDYLINFFV